MRRRIVLIVGCVLIAGCGGSSHSKTQPSTGASTAAAPSPTAQLEQAARSAVRANQYLSNWVLWHNVLPAWAKQSTDGPALTALRASAATRRAQHLQLRGISPHFDVLAITLDASYQAATATVRERGEVLPYRNGRVLGHPIKVNDTARVELHRSGPGLRFVVWKVGST